MITSRRFVYTAAFAYAVVFAGVGLTNYLIYVEPRFDLGNMVQAVWSTAHGHFLRTTTAGGIETSRLGSHVDPFLVLLVPLWWVWANPILLFVAEAIAVASGALPVYWLGRKHLGNSRTAAAFAAVYLVYPATQFNAAGLIGIHAVSFAIPLILYAIWFLDEDRLVPFALFAVLAASTKEEIAAAVGALGIWYAVRRGHRTAGLLILGVGLAITCFNMLFVIPHYAVHGASPFAGRYEGVGGTPGGMLHVALHNPVAFVHQVATWHKFAFVMLLLAPLFGLWALEPLMLLGAVPDLAINLLSAHQAQTTIFYQYTAGIVPFVIAASVLGASRLRWQRKRILRYVMIIAGCLALISPVYATGYAVHQSSGRDIAATRHALALIPRDAALSVSQSLGGYVSARRYVSVFPSLNHAEWVLVGPPRAGYDDPKTFNRKIVELAKNKRWKLVYAAPKVAVFKRR